MNMIMNEAASQNVCTLSWSAFCFPSFTLDKNHESYNFQLHIYKLRDRIIATKLHVQTFLFRISACLDPVIDLMLLSTGLKLHSKSNKKHWSELLNVDVGYWFWLALLLYDFQAAGQWFPTLPTIPFQCISLMNFCQENVLKMYFICTVELYWHI